MLKANWYKAAKFCRYHGMQLASIESQEENDKLEKHIKDFGKSPLVTNSCLMFNQKTFKKGIVLLYAFGIN